MTPDPVTVNVDTQLTKVRSIFRGWMVPFNSGFIKKSS